jgi:hypothetical protein
MDNQQLSKGENMNSLERKIKERFPNEDIEVLNFTIMKEPATVKCIRCGQTYTLSHAENFVRKAKTCICKKCVNNHTGGRLSIEDFQTKINVKYPHEKLLVLNFTDTKSQCSIKCLKCGNTTTLLARSFLVKEKKNVCHFCHKNKQEIMNNKLNEFYEWIKEQNTYSFFPLPKDIHSHTLILSKCNVCGNINKKTIYDYMRERGCPVCAKNTLKTKLDFQKEIGEEYNILEYKGMDHSCLIKHNLCNFVYKRSPRHYTCPKCGGSKGEKKIRYYLNKNNIIFEEQKVFNIKGHKLRVDFYLPTYNLAIEYQGEQHYKPIDFFGGQKTFEKQVLYDNYKREYFKNNLLEIPYTDYDNIEQILNKLLP